MCGIVGEINFSGNSVNAELTKRALRRLKHRGPDNQGIAPFNTACFGHARLSILDVSSAANQPMTDRSGRYTLIFNGEIYNYKHLAETELDNAQKLNSTSDTEVLLQLLIRKGKDALELLNGFFAFCFYDTQTGDTLIARDRLGIKPLYYHHQAGGIQFASELKSLLAYDIPKDICGKALNLYFQLNYIPAPHSIIQGVKKLLPGHLLEIKGGELHTQEYYTIPWNGHYKEQSYEEACNALRNELQSAVNLRMVSDVPLGSFLSGGIDSSIIATLAAQQTDKLKTFSIGYSDEPFFDETNYAQLVADHIGSDHTAFKLSNRRILEQLPKVLAQLDEPFADSSSIAVNVLSELTKKHVTVALSGDGADEIFSGYNKHAAEFMLRTAKIKTALIRNGKTLWNALPHSRGSKFGNLFRQLDRFADGASLSPAERYWKWASFYSAEASEALLNQNYHADIRETKAFYTKHIWGKTDLTDVLHADCRLVLPNDMLTKVDRMSMAHALEVRTPFIDHNLVAFGFSLPSEFKITKSLRKRILQDSYKSMLPTALYDRPKHGFEVPLRRWMTKELRNQIEGRYLNPENPILKTILSKEATLQLKSRLFSKDPGDSHLTTWAVMVLDHWLEDILTLN